MSLISINEGVLKDEEEKTKTISTQDSTLKIEYKEFTFETNSNKDIEKKVADFWEAIGDRKPKIGQFSQSVLNLCNTTSQNESFNEEEDEDLEGESKQLWKYTKTFCLFKNRGLKEVAMAGVPDRCNMCNNEKFGPKFADEECTNIMKDYGSNDNM